MRTGVLKKDSRSIVLNVRGASISVQTHDVIDSSLADSQQYGVWIIWEVHILVYPEYRNFR